MYSRNSSSLSINSSPNCSQGPQLINLFEPSTPSRPRHDSASGRKSWLADHRASRCADCQSGFTFYRRRHHCRRCGLIFCANCSNNRLTKLRGPNDSSCYRLCNSCMDDLIDSGQAVIQQVKTCSVWTRSYQRTAAIIFLQERSLPIDEPLIRLDDDTIQHSMTSRLVAPTPIRIASVTALHSVEEAEINSPGFFSRFWSLFFSFSNPPLLQTSPRTLDSPLMDICPVCSITFRKWTSKKRQEHVEDCIKRAEAQGTILGDRYTTFLWRREEIPMGKEEKDCSICYETFDSGQAIAVLNCLCQFHERCIEAWFERGKNCPFHSGG